MKKFIVYPGNNPNVIKKALLSRRIWEDIGEESEEALQTVQFIWKPTNLTIRGYAVMNELGRDNINIQIFNHFEINLGLCTKTGLIRSLKHYYISNDQASLNRYTVWESTPTTYLITAGYENIEYMEFLERYKDISKRNFSKEHIPEKHCVENMWLIKPANLNQGKGIEVFKNLKDIQNFLNTRPPNTYWVVQKYIEKPLLYNSRKFDIRIWVLFTYKNELFFYKKGYMRTSSSEYDMANNNNYIHLTNNCLQKYGDNYGKHEPGNTLDLDILKSYIEQKYPQYQINFQKHIIGRMKDLIIDTILSTKKSMNPNKRKYCFELFGYDFLIDEDLRVWLIEVNTNPYLGIANNYIKVILPNMIDDMLQIVLDIHYPPGPSYTKSRKIIRFFLNIMYYKDRENDFELIYCESGSIYHNGPFNVRSSFSESIYPIPSIAPPIKAHRYISMPSLNNNLNNMIGFPDNQNFDPKASSDQNNEQNNNLINGEKYNSSLTDSVEIRNFSKSQINNQKSKKTDPAENIYQYVANSLETLYYNDYEILLTPTFRILSMLVNWELLEDKSIKTACKALELVSKSHMCTILTEPLNVNLIINILNSQNIPMHIQISTITSILNVCKDFRQKKKIVCDKMVHALIKIAIASCDPNQMRLYDIKIIELAIKCLCTLSGAWTRRMWIPGETRDNDKVRTILAHQGGILALLIISKKALNDDIKKIPNKECFGYLELSDWEMQKQILQKAKDPNKMQHFTRKSVSDADENLKLKLMNKAMPRFLLSGNPSPKNEMKRISMSKEITECSMLANEIKISLPEDLISRKDYMLEEIQNDIEDMIQRVKSWLIKRELEEGERREQEKIQKIKAEEDRKQAYEEKRKKAEEEFLKRLEEKKRQKDEITKKQNEELKLKLEEIRQERQAKLLELLRKKEGIHKQQYLDQKKKKIEEEPAKVLQIEEEKVEKSRMQKMIEKWEKTKRMQKKQIKQANDKDKINLKQEKINEKELGLEEDSQNCGYYEKDPLIFRKPHNPEGWRKRDFSDSEKFEKNVACNIVDIDAKTYQDVLITNNSNRVDDRKTASAISTINTSESSVRLKKNSQMHLKSIATQKKNFDMDISGQDIDVTKVKYTSSYIPRDMSTNSKAYIYLPSINLTNKNELI